MASTLHKRWTRPTDAGPRPVWCRVLFEQSVYRNVRRLSTLEPQTTGYRSAAPPLTRPCPRGVTQLARLAPIARTDRPREHSARQAYARHDEFQHEPHIGRGVRHLPCWQFCVGGLQNSCGRSTFNPLVGQSLQTACRSCPQNAVTKGIAAISASQCVCIAGYYNHRPSNATVECIVCPAGSKCVDRGTTLASLPLWAAAAGLFRSFNLSWGC